jgi:hypothetical protein
VFPIPSNFFRKELKSMLLPNIFGAYDSRELPNLRINIGGNTSGVDMAQVFADIRRYADFFDRAVQTYENGLAVRSTDAFGTYYMGTRGAKCNRIPSTGKRKQRAPIKVGGIGVRRFGVTAIGSCIRKNT